MKLTSKSQHSPGPDSTENLSYKIGKALRGKQLNITVGIADMQVSNNPDATLVTYSLGSCIGVMVYDPTVRVGGMLHFMLPDSKLDQVKARTRPYMFADTGIPLLFKASYKLGAKKNRMLVKITGGSEVMDAAGVFNIGKRNYAALRKIFWKNNVLINSEDIGGNVNRTVRLSITSGEIMLRISSKDEKIL